MTFLLGSPDYDHFITQFYYTTINEQWTLDNTVRGKPSETPYKDGAGYRVEETSAKKKDGSYLISVNEVVNFQTF